MTNPPPAGHAPRYRVVVYELDRDSQTKIMDDTASGFIAAAATIDHGEMDITLADGGTRPQTAHRAIPQQPIRRLTNQTHRGASPPADTR